MAIMRRCCCFGDTRSGSLASGIYSLIYTIVYCGILGWGFSGIQLSIGIVPDIVIAMYYVEFVAYGLAFVGSILLIIGATKDIAPLVLTYAILYILMILSEVATYIVLLTLLGLAAIILIIPFVFFLVFLTFNILCVLCTISQFQELKAGRGRLEDIQAANTQTTTVIVTTGQPIMTNQPPPGSFVVQQQPPTYGQQQPTAYGQYPAYGQPPQPPAPEAEYPPGHDVVKL